MPLSPQMKKTVSGKRQQPMPITYITKTRTAQLLMLDPHWTYQPGDPGMKTQ